MNHNIDTMVTNQFNQVLIYIDKNNTGEHYTGIKNLFNTYGIDFQEVDVINPNDTENLYILFDVANWAAKDLPKFYVAYESFDFRKFNSPEEFFKKPGKISESLTKIMKTDSYMHCLKLKNHKA